MTFCIARRQFITLLGGTAFVARAHWCAMSRDLDECA
jgi:hypothetical protein